MNCLSVKIILAGLKVRLPVVESLIRSKDVPVFPFKRKGDESSNVTDDDYRNMVKRNCKLSSR